MPLHKAKVLVLNASYEPLSICDARNAVLLLFGGKAMVVVSHPEHRIRTVSESFPLPSIVLSRKNIFRRDGYRCQYCGRSDLQLTLDHVIPKSRGGEDRWDNLITACKPCNTFKGNRTPAEAGMTMLQNPSCPSHIALMRQHFLSISDEWKPYLFMT